MLTKEEIRDLMRTMAVNQECDDCALNKLKKCEWGNRCIFSRLAEPEERPPEIRITLNGVPPSLNQIAGKDNPWKYRKAKAEWTELVCWAAKATKDRPQHPYDKADVYILYYFTDRRRRDADNYCGKFLLDGLTKAGIIADDSFDHISLHIDGTTGKPARTEITVIERRAPE